MAIKGRARLNRQMIALPPAVKAAVEISLKEGGEQIVASQKRLVPVRSGALRDSIKSTVGGGQGVRYAAFGGSKSSGTQNDLKIRITAGNSQARHAALVEFGTAPHEQGGRFKGSQHPGTRAQPFFFPGYRANRKSVKSKIARAGKKAIREVASK